MLSVSGKKLLEIIWNMNVDTVKILNGLQFFEVVFALKKTNREKSVILAVV